MADDLVKQIRRLGGRFLRRHPDESVWRDAGDDEARRKVMQVWRDPHSFWAGGSAQKAACDPIEVSRQSQREKFMAVGVLCPVSCIQSLSGPCSARYLSLEVLIHHELLLFLLLDRLTGALKVRSATWAAFLLSRCSYAYNHSRIHCSRLHKRIATIGHTPIPRWNHKSSPRLVCRVYRRIISVATRPRVLTTLVWTTQNYPRALRIHSQ
jgi:hypothetical protein